MKQKFKETEIAKIPEDWKVKQIKEVVTKLGDGLHGTPNYDEKGEYYFVNGNNLVNGKIQINNKTKNCSEEEFYKYKKDLHERTIFVSINGTIGNVALYNGEKIILGKSACYLNVKKEFSLLYIKYVLNNNYFQNYIQTNATGTTIKNVSLKQMREFKFGIPESISEQKAVAKILSDFDDKIEVLQKQNKTLEEIGRTVFRHWFVDFEFPDENGKPYKSSGGKMIKSELGEIPKGWKIGKLETVVEITSSKRIFQSEYQKTGIPFFRSKEIIELHSGKNISLELFISIERYKEIKEKFGAPKHKEILLTSVGTIGIPYLVRKNDYFYFKDGNLTWFRNFKENFSGPFIYYWFMLKSTQQQIDAVTMGSTQKALTIQGLNNLDICIPKSELVNECSNILNKIISKKENNLEQIQSLQKTRDLLLPKLMSGQIRVK